MQAMWSRAMPTLLRSAIIAVAIAVGSTGHDALSVLPWALMILLLDLVAGRLLGFGPGQSGSRRSQAMFVTLLGAVVAGAAIAASPVPPLSPAMLLLLIPAFRAGEVRGPLAPAVVVGFESYPMRRTLKMNNRYEALVPVTAGKDVLDYHFKVEYEYDRFGNIRREAEVVFNLLS